MFQRQSADHSLVRSTKVSARRLCNRCRQTGTQSGMQILQSRFVIPRSNTSSSTYSARWGAVKWRNSRRGRDRASAEMTSLRKRLRWQISVHARHTGEQALDREFAPSGAPTALTIIIFNRAGTSCNEINIEEHYTSSATTTELLRQCVQTPNLRIKFSCFRLLSNLLRPCDR
ncbi:hypothetical protein BDN71DRAFT_224680 [Pleurotus eryngii]|uniref:Uncharacterized protein n=1 Tax=Pleurotus eryngii TaxID=5323 RepID=A0A9P6A586_PLEER|nr:hypothetical protein BDN71DRAFT_224680 [Pleurotus eryngii]